MAFVFSPSNMGTYKDCPRKFQGQSITKEIPWKASTQKSRGSLVHTEVQNALKHGMQAVSIFQDGVDPFYVTQCVNDARQQVADGGRMFIEHELCINDKFRKTGWWDDDALLRARADVLVLPGTAKLVSHTDASIEPHEVSDVSLPAEVIDIKTGKIWDKDDFQLRVEALLVHLIYQRPTVKYAYLYVDQGQTVDGVIDFRHGLTQVQDIIELMKEMKLAIRDNNFPAKKNKFCKWCSLHQTPACGL